MSILLEEEWTEVAITKEFDNDNTVYRKPALTNIVEPLLN